jgi:hypothetical protein
MLESRFPTSMSLSRKSTGLLTPAQIGVREQSRTSSAELFREQVQDVVDGTQSSTTVQNPGLHDGLWEKNESIKFPNQETNNESLRPEFEMQSSGQNRDGKQDALIHQGNSPLERLTPSVDSVSQKNLLLQKGANWSAASREFQSGKEQTSAAALDGQRRRLRPNRNWPDLNKVMFLSG